MRYLIAIGAFCMMCSCNVYADNTPQYSFELTVGTSGQSNEVVASFIDVFMEERDGSSPDQTLINISSTMLNNISVEVEDTTWNEMFNRLNQVKVFMEKSNPRFYNETKQGVENSNIQYEELMEIVRGEKKHLLLLQRDDDLVKEVLMIYQSGDNGGIISLRGDLREQDIKTLREDVDMDNVEEVPGFDGW